ncbi:hypothetical protein ACHAWF_015489, partial [Thalassiosira exigua]
RRRPSFPRRRARCRARRRRRRRPPPRLDDSPAARWPGATVPSQGRARAFPQPRPTEPAEVVRGPESTRRDEPRAEGSDQADRRLSRSVERDRLLQWG